MDVLAYEVRERIYNDLDPDDFLSLVEIYPEYRQEICSYLVENYQAFDLQGLILFQVNFPEVVAAIPNYQSYRNILAYTQHEYVVDQEALLELVGTAPGPLTFDASIPAWVGAYTINCTLVNDGDLIGDFSYQDILPGPLRAQHQDEQILKYSVWFVGPYLYYAYKDFKIYYQVAPTGVAREIRYIQSTARWNLLTTDLEYYDPVVAVIDDGLYDRLVADRSLQL